MSWARFAKAAARTIWSLAMSPVILILFFFVLIGIGIIVVIAIPGTIVRNLEWSESLRKQGRIGDPDSKSGRYRSGTLIVDSFTPAKGVLRCWWTPDDIRAISPFEVPGHERFEDRLDEVMRNHPIISISLFDLWVHDRYIHPETGTAILLATQKGDRCAERLRRENPGLDMIVTWSALVARRETHDRQNRDGEQGQIGNG
jgi:hypothetical protein